MRPFGTVRNIIHLFRSLVPFLLSHHPLCSRFDLDTYPFLRYRFCLGCSLTYPTAGAVAIIDILTRFDRMVPTYFLHKEILFIVAGIMGFMQALKYLIPPESRALRAVVKIALGLSIGGYSIWIFTFPASFPVQMILFIVFASSLAFLASYRYNYLRRVCSGCIYHGDWDICYGFLTINQHCRIRPNLRGRALISLMFDRDRKRRLEGKGLTRPCSKTEPELKDDRSWLYHEPGYSIFWLPSTGLEVEDEREIPR